MVHAFGDVLAKRRPLIEDADIRHGIERYLRQSLKSQSVYCKRIEGGVAEVSAVSPTLRQEIMLLEYDLRLMLKKELGFKLEGLRVRLF